MKVTLDVGCTSTNQSGPLQAKALYKGTNIVSAVHVREL